MIGARMIGASMIGATIIGATMICATFLETTTEAGMGVEMEVFFSATLADKWEVATLLLWGDRAHLRRWHRRHCRQHHRLHNCRRSQVLRLRLSLLPPLPETSRCTTDRRLYWRVSS